MGKLGGGSGGKKGDEGGEGFWRFGPEGAGEVGRGVGVVKTGVSMVLKGIMIDPDCGKRI